MGAYPFPGHGADLRRSITAIFNNNPIFHNHNPDGSFCYSTPKIRYIVDQGVPKLISIFSGNQELELLYDFFDDSVICLDVKGKNFPIEEVILTKRTAKIGTSKNLIQYHSLTPWLALNSNNSKKFNLLYSGKKNVFLSKLFNANILSLAKNLNLWISETINSRVIKFSEVPIKSGKMNMLGIYCFVETNFIFDRLIGLGKLVSKGFGRFATNDSFNQYSYQNYVNQFNQ